MRVHLLVNKSIEILMFSFESNKSIKDSPVAMFAAMTVSSFGVDAMFEAPGEILSRLGSLDDESLKFKVRKMKADWDSQLLFGK